MKNSLLFILTLSICLISLESAQAQSSQTFDKRQLLCVKKIGKKNFEKKDIGRDAYLAAGKCRDGYFPLLTNQETGPKGDKGDAGPQGVAGPQGPRGPGGGTIIGTLVECDGGKQPSILGEVGSTPDYFVYLPGESIHVKIPGNSLSDFVGGQGSFSSPFRMSNVPAGTYNIQIDIGTHEERVRRVHSVSVADDQITDVGTIEACFDRDDDGFDSPGDCNDSNPAIHPGAEEVCDFQDNNCNGQVDEGCDD